MTVYLLVAILVLALLTFLWVRRARRGKQYYPESTQLYVGNLSYSANSHQLKDFFADYAEVDNVRLIKNSRTGRSKGFAFVTFTNLKEAKKALAVNGKDFRGRAMVVRMAKPRDAE